MTKIKADIEIAREADMKPIGEIAGGLGIPEAALLSYGPVKAKISLDFIKQLDSRDDGRLILVTAISPTPAGEGKTTTSVGLGDALRRIGKNSAICLREPSLGPCFGMKGGAAGGGYAQVVPMEDINLHFTGDFHAIGVANNLLSALIDNHIYWGNELGFDERRITWRRVVDMNDRALRNIVTSLGGVANGFPAQTGFDITVASEVMAVFCLAVDMADLQRRLGNITVGYTRARTPIYARDLKAEGPLSVLLKDAFMPNIVQTLENSPAFIHGGPFANIAHGCNSVIATRTALKLCDYVVTEAGFGADLGAEKFFNIKARKAGLTPDAVVVVATIKALKLHGGVAPGDLKSENMAAVKAGCANLERHVRNIGQFGVPAIVAINRFSSDTDAEIRQVQEFVTTLGVEAVEANHWLHGGAGAEELAKKVVEIIDGSASQFRPLYSDDLGLFEKINTIARSIYGAQEAIADKKVRAQLRKWEEEGFSHLPICMAKTQYSFSSDPNLKGAPTNHVVPVREVRLSTGAEFVIAICGEIMTMPGLPRKPAANQIKIGKDGLIEGLF